MIKSNNHVADTIGSNPIVSIKKIIIIITIINMPRMRGRKKKIAIGMHGNPKDINFTL